MNEQLSRLVLQGGGVVLSGAGLSTESGIPDYRGPTGTARRATPMTYQAFVGSAQARQRYWARSHQGWRFIAAAEPNAGHHAVAQLQEAGLLDGVITQNVDGLHQRAGATDVLELHGGLTHVVCLQCGSRSPRSALASRMRHANPGFGSQQGLLAPDGDADLDDVTDFRVLDCLDCGGLLKPDVVFFGETVPQARVERSLALVDSATTLLVLGSSLQVMSGYRFVLRAAKVGVPVAIVNQGPTRGDPLAALRLDAPLGEALTALAAQTRARKSA